ncbi:MAG: helix-turn-helix domain containing protein [Deltaproteobacteria bacterium]|nr:helix-turn-helix domain containing protein [Deltaproteobacteria bacterium]
MARPAGAEIARIGRRGRRPQARALATRRRVLDAAEALYARRGYEPTSMADVAERAGVGVGTLYHHFPDKRALLLALIDDWGDRELTRARDAHDVGSLFGEHLRSGFADFLRTNYERLRREGGFYLVLLELAERDGDVRTRLERIHQVGIERLRDLLVLGQHRGIVRAGLDPLAAAFLIRRSIQAAAREVFVHRMTEPAPQQVLAELIEMVDRYVFVEEAG